MADKQDMTVFLNHFCHFRPKLLKINIILHKGFILRVYLIVTIMHTVQKYQVYYADSSGGSF